MNYKLIELKPATKALAKIQPAKAKQIRRKMQAIAQDPYGEHNNAKPLKGETFYRLRVGQYRVFYEIRNQELVVLMLDVQPRGSAYQH